MSTSASSPTPRADREGDLALARRCLAGDVRAQMELFRAQKHRVHATLYRVLGSNTDMDDLVQDTFIEVFRSLRGFRGDALLATWVDRIAVRVALGQIGRRRADPVRLSVVPDLASKDASAEDRAVAREAMRRLYDMLDRLEPNQRVAYALHVIDGRALAEVAEIMDASVVTTKVRAWRAARTIERRAAKDPLLARYVSKEVG